MKTTSAVNKLRAQRILYIITGSMLVSLLTQLIFYSLFLISPSLFIKAGLIAYSPMIFICAISLILPLSHLIYRFQPFGENFLASIISAPYTSSDLRSALELEINKSHPGKYSLKDNNFTAYLSERYCAKIINNIKTDKKLLKKLFPDIKRILFIISVVFISVLLSIANKDLVTDVYTALRTGLPAELIALDTPLKFEKLEAVVIPPAYLDVDSRKVTNLNIKKKIKVMQGSSVFLKGTLHNIQKGKLILSTEKGVEYFSVTIVENQIFEVTFLAPMKGAFALEFFFSKQVNDKLSGKSKVFMIEALTDQPPTIRIFSPPENHNIVFGNSFGISFLATDDYGILEITLRHRDTEIGGDYNRELIARFPKDPKTNYSNTYVWNPVLREGKKIDELIYHPGTKKIEYFIQVKDINIFSSGGIARSEMRYVLFINIFSEYKEGINLIQELIDEGKKLTVSLNDRGLKKDYKIKLKNAVDIFSKELLEIMPRSNLIQKTHRMINILSTQNAAAIKKPLESYIAYLERLLTFLKYILGSESSSALSAETSRSHEMDAKKMDSSLKRIGQLAEMLEKEFKDELEEIQKLIEKGDHVTAQAKMSELLEKIRKRIDEELQKSMEMAKKIADEVKQKLEKMTGLSEKLLKRQEKNKKITDKGKRKNALIQQEEINKGLIELNDQTEKLSLEYPFIMGSLNSYARSARIFGEKAKQKLEKNKLKISSEYQKQVISRLKGFLQSLSRQKKLMEDMAKGNFENLMPRDSSNRFVFIPQEAVYTIPIDYKSRIIEMSKERSKNTREKEAFWRDILE